MEINPCIPKSLPRVFIFQNELFSVKRRCRIRETVANIDNLVSNVKPFLLKELDVLLNLLQLDVMLLTVVERECPDLVIAVCQ